VNLTITDGFKFGCGVLLAFATGIVFLLLGLSLAAFVSTLAGFRPPIPGL
jgi:hypothetical protein